MALATRGMNSTAPVGSPGVRTKMDNTNQTLPEQSGTHTLRWAPPQRDSEGPLLEACPMLHRPVPGSI